VFFVSVASKGFSFGASSLDATVADGWVDVDSKADASGRLGVSNGSVGAEGRMDFDAAAHAAVEAAGENENSG
jgi:hypothetical protein